MFKSALEAGEPSDQRVIPTVGSIGVIGGEQGIEPMLRK
jgi:hypothetical protein